MPPVPAEAFASEFRDRPASDRVGFVAALWAARGWETTVEDGRVVAERDGDRRRIAVVDPGRFGTPEFEGVDTLVVTRDRRAVRDAADEAGVEYVPPAELRELLLYGIERDTAETLYAAWFDRPLQREPADGSETEGLRGVVTTALSSLGGNRRAAVALLLVAVVGIVVAGPVLTGGTAPEQSPITVGNVTPEAEGGGAIGAASPTPTERPGLLPGVTRAGVVEPYVLAEAHAASVRNRSRVRSVRVTGPPNDSIMGGTTARNLTTRIVNRSHYRHRSISRFAGGDEPEWTGLLGVYADGERVYQRLSVGGDTRYSRYSIAERPATRYDDLSSSLYRYFVGADSIVRCAIDFQTDCPTYRIVVDGDPPTMLEEEVEGYEALAIVSDRGMITTIRASYTLPDSDDDGERERVRFELDYEFEAVDVSPPEWLPEARNATGARTPSTPPNTTTANATATSTATPPG